MKITAISNVQNIAHREPQFVGKPVVIQQVVDSLLEIFAKPLQQRSNHLLHEFDPTTRKPILGRFKLEASDGAKLTVFRSLKRDNGEYIRYIGILKENDDAKKVVRINADNAMIIKSGLNIGDSLEYFKESEATEVLNFINKYLPDITRNDISQPKKEMTQAVIRHLTRELDADKIVNEAPEYHAGMDLVKTSELHPKRATIKQDRLPFSTTVLKMSKTATVPQTDIVKFLDNEASLLKIADILERYKNFGIEKSVSERYKFLVRTLGKYVDRVPGARALILKNVDGDHSARILALPDRGLLRLTLHDDKGKVVRGYLIKDSEKLVKNFNVANYNMAPKSLKYMSEQDYRMLAPNFEQDVQNIKRQIEIVNNIMESTIH